MTISHMFTLASYTAKDERLQHLTYEYFFLFNHLLVYLSLKLFKDIYFI